MRNESRIWVIEDEDRPDITSLGDAIETAPRRPAPRPTTTRTTRTSSPASTATRPRRREAPTRPPRAPRPVQAAILLGLAYVLGPAGLLLTARGRRGGPWLAVAGGTLVFGGFLGWAWWWAATRGIAGNLLAPLLAATLVGFVAAFSAWSHSLHLLLTSRRYPGLPWPAWIRRPWAALTLGLVAPGSSWVLTRWPRRAAWTVWAIWPAAAAALLLLQAPLLWQQRGPLAAAGLPADSLERLFLAAGAVLLVAPLAWFAQALTAARALAVVAGRWQHGRGDWSAVALALVLVLVVASAGPAQLAAELAAGADVLRAAECRVLPVKLTDLALRLDPGRPEYVLQLADLHAARGDEAAAARVRADVVAELSPYLGALLTADAQPVVAQAAPPASSRAVDRAARVAATPSRTSGDGAPALVLPGGLVLPGPPYPAAREGADALRQESSGSTLR